MSPELREHRLDVLVDVEILRLLPRLLDLVGDLPRARGAPAHPDHDSLGERDPDLFVVPVVRVILQALARGRAGLVVAGDVELDAVPPADPQVSLRPALGTRLGER